MFVGGGSQSQVFYNLYVALAVLLVLRVEEQRGGLWQLVMAMGLIGLAMTYKQTALCQGVLLGGWALWRQRRRGRDWRRLRLLALGMALAGLALGPLRDGTARPGRALPLVWLAGSVGEPCIIPNFYADYTLPLLTPLALCAGLALSRRPWAWWWGPWRSTCCWSAHPR